ncbi:NUDIX domain-containing protein [Lysinibacillus sp. NPDC097214]|uniref:NUDIX domain-containing protein n=1 Tax=Lysinibacillus sp. NPDC097214 TaxID=3390584 RepID=UPI003D037BD2
MKYEAKKWGYYLGNYIKEMRELIGTRPLMVAGSTVVVINAMREILLQQRSDNNKWGFPGGAMEYGESLEETSIRELYERTSLVVPNVSSLN